MFADDACNEAMATDGYVVLAQRLDADTVESLAALYQSVIDTIERDDFDGFRPSMTIQDPAARARLWDGVRQLTSEFLEPVFLPGTTEVVGGSFVSKPASATSQREPHQDPTVFDEQRDVSVSLWVPLSDSTLENGTLQVLPRSHRMGNLVRPPDVPSFDEEVRAIALAESIPLELEAGQIVVLDGGLIHHSLANRSGQERIATICAVRSIGAEMLIVRSEGGKPEGTATVFEAGVETFRSGDLIEPDLARLETVGEFPYRRCAAEDLARSRDSRPH